MVVPPQAKFARTLSIFERAQNSSTWNWNCGPLASPVSSVGSVWFPIPMENIVMLSTLARSAWIFVIDGYFESPSVITMLMSGAPGRSLKELVCYRVEFYVMDL
ncbi:hypothetical protein DPMN_105487 [Dreissena polymorpha]|uniref:Uncharacterized protein n=1 Tax=Dreissena polymorpha TaxID=45954 RepID=A0A9D4HBQ9_DREPO|nr:hypothetical protein DPMN_105397 [Dreissena polymorpha]KAH3832208.1 hypothetical protein DPMN_105487 [Dreissena polymorpha]